MSQIILPSTAAAAVNQNNVYVPYGYSTGGGTSVTSGATNTKGTAVFLGTVTNALAGFFLDVGMSSSASIQYLIDVSVDNGSTWAVQNIYAMPGTTGAYLRTFIPINVSAGAQFSVRVQGSTANGTLVVAITGIERNANSPPLFSTFTALNIDSTTTKPSTVDVPLTNTWVELINSTSAAYGAIFAVTGHAALPTIAQGASSAIGIGSSGAETEITRWGMSLATSNPPVRNASSVLAYKSIPSGSRIVGRIQAATTADNLRIALYGCN